MAQKTMYPAINNSPVTTLAQNISVNADTIELVDASVLPAAPNIATIGTDESAELVLYTSINGSSITGCTRGFNGTTARDWASGSKVYRGITAYDHDTFRDNISDLSSGKVDKPQGAVIGNLAQYGSNGAITDSGKKVADFATAQQGSKADTALQPVTGATENNFAALDVDGKPIDSGKKASDFATASQGTKADSAVQNVKIGGIALAKDSSKAVDIIVNAANGLARLDGNAKVPEILIPGQYRQNHNFNYDGMDLSTMFTEAELHQKTADGNFVDIKIGDYWPVTITGTYKDYGDGSTKSLNGAIVKYEVAGIATYAGYGDVEVPINHLILCPRDALPSTTKWRSENSTWTDTSVTNPMLGSAIYATMNANDGLLPLVKATGIGTYMYTGPNGKGMRWLAEIKASTAADATSWGWVDRGCLFLPSEREVWGQDVWSEHRYGGSLALQWPIFAGTRRHIRKGLGNGGSRCAWWCCDSGAGSAANACLVNGSGYPDTYAASGALAVVPCFLFV